MNLSEFVDGLATLELQLGKPPVSEELYERWVLLKYKPVSHLGHQRWLAIAEAGANELQYWNQLTTHWITTKAHELSRPELAQLLPASTQPGTPCPDYVKVWMAEERGRLGRLTETEVVTYQAARGVLPAGGTGLTEEVRAELAFGRDRIHREGLTPEERALLSDPLTAAVANARSLELTYVRPEAPRRPSNPPVRVEAEEWA